MVDNSVTKDGTSEFRNADSVETFDIYQVSTNGRNCVINTQVDTFDVRNPDKTCARLIIERSDRAVSNTKNVGAFLICVRDNAETWDVVDTVELEDTSRPLNDIDVDVSTFEWVDASTCVDGVLVLVGTNDSVTFIWTVLIATKIVEIEEIGLSRLSSHNTNALNIATREC